MKKNYNHTREIKKVSLGVTKDADIISYIKDKEFSTYVKKLIRADMANHSAISYTKNN